jgi:hypothetical protein
MNLKNMNKSFVTASIAVTALLFATSCTKDTGSPAESGDNPSVLSIEKPITNKRIQDRILELKGMLPTVVVYNSTMDKYISLDLNNPKSFNFTSPSGGASFSSPSGSVQFVPAGNNNFTIVTTPASAGGGGGGGLITAGDVSLSVSYVLCFNSGDALDDLNFFDLGPSDTGFGGAIGIAGDFEQLAQGEIDEENTDVTDFFQGFVAFFAFDGQPSGSYPVIDFFAFEEDFDGDFSDKGLSYFFSFQENNTGIFFSKSGTVNFGSSSVEFTGTYYGVTGFSFFDFEESEDEPDYVEVSGNGLLECGG